MGNTRDTGHLRNVLTYDSSGRISIGGAVDTSYMLKVTGAVGITGATTLSGVLTGTVAIMTDVFAIKKTTPAGYSAHLAFQNTSGVNRWGIGVGTAETGSSNVGTDLYLYSYDDAGSVVSSTYAMRIIRASKAVDFAGTVSIGGGLTGTSATFGGLLAVQNNAGFRLNNATNSSWATLGFDGTSVTNNYGLSLNGNLLLGSNATYKSNSNSYFTTLVGGTTNSYDVQIGLTNGESWGAIVLVSSVLNASAAFRNYYTFSMHARGVTGTAATLQNVTTANSPSRTAIAVTFPSNGVARFTLTGPDAGDTVSLMVTVLGYNAV